MPLHGFIISNLKKIFDWLVSWLSTRSSGMQLGLFCLLCLFKCCGGVGWFFLSGRLRRDCHSPCAAYLENMCWHARPCVCQSFITLPKLLPLFLLRGDADIVWISSCVRPSPRLFGSGTWRCLQIKTGKVGGERLQRATATGVWLLLLWSQPLTVVILAWFKGLLHCQQERGPSLLAALYFIRGSSLRWVMPELWLTDYGGINKYNLILIKSDKASVWRIQAGQALLYTETKGLICGDVCRFGLRSDIFYH